MRKDFSHLHHVTIEKKIEENTNMVLSLLKGILNHKS